MQYIQVLINYTTFVAVFVQLHSFTYKVTIMLSFMALCCLPSNFIGTHVMLNISMINFNILLQ